MSRRIKVVPLATNLPMIKSCDEQLFLASDRLDDPFSVRGSDA